MLHSCACHPQALLHGDADPKPYLVHLRFRPVPSPRSLARGTVRSQIARLHRVTPGLLLDLWVRSFAIPATAPATLRVCPQGVHALVPLGYGWSNP